MDEASAIVSQLQIKLAELDHKVWKYQRDMVSEFDKYAQDLLRDVSKDVSETVSKAIAESMKDYKSLNLDASTAIESCAPGTNAVSNSNGIDDLAQLGMLKASISFKDTPLNASDEPSSPHHEHDREKEFQGVFTPSFLPLLDGTHRNEPRSSHQQAASPESEHKARDKEMSGSLTEASAATTRPLAPSPDFEKPATPQRRNTDELSVTSDASDGPVRRSALRRSSSSSKTQSPRRVRFDVEGEEVLPTAAVEPEKPILSENALPGSFEITEDWGEGPAIEQVEDVEEAPPPKRVSSTQALRALSRGPFEDDGTTWTTVSAPADGSGSVATANSTSAASMNEVLTVGKGQSGQGLGGSRESENIPHRSTGSDQSDPVPTSSTASLEENTDDNDGLVDIPGLRSSQDHESAPARILSPENPTTANAKSLTASTKSPGTSWQDFQSFSRPQGDVGEGLQFDEEDHDELFNFDENTKARSPPPPQEEEEEGEEESDTASPASPFPPSWTQPIRVGSYPRSSAQETMKPAGAQPTSYPSFRSSVGSYKGHPFNMPIVSDEIHAQAASLGELNSFVGSLNGRSGLDESDVQSFRASGGYGSFSGFSGTPRSMSERMMMDEMMEAEEAARKK